MSAKATFWAWKQRGLSASEKLVLLCLSDCHNSSTNRCDPSVAFISDNTSLNRKTVMKTFESLEKSGFISVEKRAGMRTNFSLKVTDSDDLTSPEIGTSPKNGTSPKIGTPTSTKIGTTPVPKLGHEPISNLEVNLKDKYKGLEFELFDGLSKESVVEYIDFRNKLKKPLTQNALNRFLSKILKAHLDPSICLTADQSIQKAIDSGWQGFEVEWLKNRVNQQAPIQPNKKPMPKAGSEQ